MPKRYYKNFGLNNQKPQRKSIVSLVMLAIVMILYTYINQTDYTIPISMHRFEQMMQQQDVEKVNLLINKNVVEVIIHPDRFKQEPYQTEIKKKNPYLKGKNTFLLRIPSIEVFHDIFKNIESNLPKENRIGYNVEERSDLNTFLTNWGSVILMLILFIYIFSKMRDVPTNSSFGPGSPFGNLFTIGRSRATLFDKLNKVPVNFKDVAGLEEAKEEVKEIVDFLKNPLKFTKLGGKIPKGILLVGAPGTGKTLLAKAVAGEAHVPFFSLSGSDFVEMFVGVGSARVRDLFKQAKQKAPCIIFIDEIDAIGRSRGRDSQIGGNDERENTLNSLLVEMDGFNANTGVIILAATNRPEVLDNALLRPGRFDRQINIDKPNLKGREQIFKVHMKKLVLTKSISAHRLATQTPGFAGAEIANVCNEAALIAGRKNNYRIYMEDFQDAIDRVIGGLEKKTKIITENEKRIVAYHEAGHALTSWFLEHAHPFVKVSIVPRGIALGYAQYLPKELSLHQKEELLDEMCTKLGGRAAEEITFNKISTGALNDLELATKLAYNMITIYGMSEELGHISFYDPKQNEYFAKPYSEKTADCIDQEVRKMISGLYEKAKSLLLEKKKELEIIAQQLIKKEVLYKKDLERLIGKKPFDRKEEKTETI